MHEDALFGCDNLENVMKFEQLHYQHKGAENLFTA
jgi:hypothetical protein